MIVSGFQTLTFDSLCDIVISDCLLHKGWWVKTTNYFTTSVMARRPYLKTEWIEYVLSKPIRTEVQANGRIRHWAFISEVGKYLRVVTEPDGQMVHNAFFDRRFEP